MTEQMKEILSHLEKFIKGGRIAFELLTKDESDEMTPRQLCVEYDYKQKVARLFTKNDQGEVVPIKSKAEDLIEEYLIKFVEVGVNKKYNYNPSIHFKLIHDTEGYTQANIERAYSYMTEHFQNLKPYIQYVRDYQNTEHGLCPFMTADAVFLNLGKIIKDKGITSTTVAIQELYSFIRDYTNGFNSVVADLSSKMDAIKQHLASDLSNLTSKAQEQTKTLEELKNVIKGIENKLSGFSDAFLKNYKLKTINVSGTTRVTVTHGKNTGVTVVGGIKAKVSSPIIAVLTGPNNSRIILEMGQNGYVTDLSGNCDTTIVRTEYRGGSAMLLNVEPVSNGYSFVTSGSITVDILSRENDINVATASGGSSDRLISNAATTTGVTTFSKGATLITRSVIMGNYKLTIR